MTYFTDCVIHSLAVAVVTSSLVQVLTTTLDSVASRDAIFDDDITDVITVPSFENSESETRVPGEADWSSSFSDAGEVDFPYWIVGTALPW